MRMIATMAALLIGSGSASAAAPESPPPAPAPNIIVIIADDLGYGDVQCLNPQRGMIKTPHLDRLAAAGMIFTDAHSGSSVCTPTRYGLLTGRYAWRTRLQSGVLDGFPAPLIAADRLTLPGLLKQQGYHTAAVGKWHLGFGLEGDGTGAKAAKKRADPAVGTRTTDGPVTRGFDMWTGVQHARSMRNFFEQDRITRHVETVEVLPLLTRHAVDHVAARAKAGGPFFLYFALTSPHTPIVPSPEWKGRSGLGDYADFVMQTDRSVGDVVDAVGKAGIADNTLIIFTSDNGCSPAAGTDALETKGHFPSGPFRGYKSDIREGGHRVPFLVRWPAKIKPGGRCDSTICLTDVMATCAAVTGATLPENAGEDSFSFLPDLSGTGKTARTSTVHHSISGRFAIREGNWKLSLCAGSGGWGKPGEAAAAKQGLPSVQLHDLKADNGETRNVQADHPDVVKRLGGLLERIVADGRSTPGAPQKNDAPVRLRKSGDDDKSDTE